MFGLLDQEVRLYYWIPNGRVIDAGIARFGESWYDAWLEGMVSRNEDVIFFLMVQSTDVFEKEWDFNEAVHSAGRYEMRLAKGLNQSFGPDHHSEPETHT